MRPSGVSQWEAVIGLEIHVQLATASKLFSGEACVFGDEPNANVGPVCAGLPGALPVLNREAVRLAVLLGLALDGRPQLVSDFARKHYFYPDLPKGYQISQLDRPVIVGGRIAFFVGTVEKQCGLLRIHLEEDAGKTTHSGGRSLVDLNRAGVPLVEIVTRPELRSAEEAAACVRELRRTVRALGVSEANMEQGSLRCDANVSVRPLGSSDLNTRVEIKNVNSFRFLQRAIEFEAKRQVALRAKGQRVIQETRLFDELSGRTAGMRGKEEAEDYRYMPDPDLPDLVLSEDEVATIGKALGEMPLEVERRLRDWGVAPDDAVLLTETRTLASFVQELLEGLREPRRSASLLVNDFLPLSADRDLDEVLGAVNVRDVRVLLSAFDEGEIGRQVATQALGRMIHDGSTAAALLDEFRTDAASVDDVLRVISEVVELFPDEAAKARAGNQGVLGFLTGQVSRRVEGAWEGRRIRELLQKELTR